MQDKYWEIKQWANTEFNLINSPSQDKSTVINEVRESFDYYLNKQISDFSLNGKFSDDDLAVVKPIYLIHFLALYCNMLEKDDNKSLDWIKQKHEEIKKFPKFSLKEEVKKIMAQSHSL